MLPDCCLTEEIRRGEKKVEVEMLRIGKKIPEVAYPYIVFRSDLRAFRGQLL